MRSLVIILIASLLLNGFFWHKMVTPDEEISSLQFPYLSKRILTSNKNDTIINFIPLRAAIREYIGAQSQKISAYFEYLPSGTSIGVNDRIELRLASLSKVPLVMSIYKKIERGTLSLDTILAVQEEHLNQKFGSLWKKGAGTTISVKELVRLSLQESDNTAYEVLFDALTAREIDEVYDGLDIEISDKGLPLVSAKAYSSIFRSLYLSSFLSKENSQEILTILTGTSFTDKIPAGVPAGVPIAHKIGVFSLIDSKEDVFSDCGIVYVPDRPYILCMFVQGEDNDARKHISYVSKMIYGYVTLVKGGH